jgi:cellulose 1,4-beta-cellobiosidase
MTSSSSTARYVHLLVPLQQYSDVLSYLQSNSVGWKPSDNDINAGSGNYGTCCAEMDIWEANKAAAAYTPHVCTAQAQTRCSGTQCGDSPANRYGGICDKDGCDFNSYRMGNQNFLGAGMTVNTNAKFTIVTQFITADGTANGALTEIRRIYVQNGKVIANSQSAVAGITATNAISDNFCAQQKTAFGDRNDFASKGGLKSMGDALNRGMVLALSIWDDHTANMLWLDSSYPLNKDPSVPGVKRGPCATTSGVPKEVEAQFPNSSVTYSNIKWGDIGSTYTAAW